MFSKILSNFPSPLRLAFAYGSGVFQQHGHAAVTQNMLDFIFVVDNPVTWHKENIKTNNSHYSFLKYFGHKYISCVQQKYGAHVYFNTLVQCEGRTIKYGVISTDDFVDDLLDWNTLYIAGRLHKPVNIIHKDPCFNVANALLTNLQSAIHASLLLLPEKFDGRQLYETVTSLSYSGDFRMKVGEDQNKIRNIVKPNIHHFRELYETILDGEQHLHWQKNDDVFEQNIESASRIHHLNLLPANLSTQLVKRKRPNSNSYGEEILKSYAYDSDCSEQVQDSIATIVKKSSLSQSIKGIFTAGLTKSLVYSSSKVKKMVKSRVTPK